MYQVVLVASAETDVSIGFWFYEQQMPGLGDYFLQCIFADIDSLKLFAGVHAKPVLDLHRGLSKRFPFSIYYRIDGARVYVLAVLDSRRNPKSIRAALIGRGN